ncbi:LPS translocon maturation chaperone LptM [Methylobacterium platani]|uniref:Lipoprotein n=1 Tax=Methylobacterium platani JCM 14648 TaxID=1295136 RepID=A0ABR5H4W8_9HYPH|nr:lipoprotein [Methylobacterium platani]KMO18940.1 hypothetical protein SQ03_09155 [Methylobacterium platani JCM 14648]
MFPTRTLVLLGLIALSAAACGRRGPLEPPPVAAPAGPVQGSKPQAGAQGAARAPTGAAAVNTLPGGVGLEAGGSIPDDADELPASAVAAPTGIPAPTVSSRRRKGYVIPKEPFPLDPLL